MDTQARFAFRTGAAPWKAAAQIRQEALLRIEAERAELQRRLEASESELAVEKGRGDFHRDIAAQVTDKGVQLDGALMALEFAARRDLEQHQQISRAERERDAARDELREATRKLGAGS